MPQRDAPGLRAKQRVAHRGAGGAGEECSEQVARGAIFLRGGPVAGDHLAAACADERSHQAVEGLAAAAFDTRIGRGLRAGASGGVAS